MIYMPTNTTEHIKPDSIGWLLQAFTKESTSGTTLVPHNVYTHTWTAPYIIPAKQPFEFSLTLTQSNSTQETTESMCNCNTCDDETFDEPTMPYSLIETADNGVFRINHETGLTERLCNDSVKNIEGRWETHYFWRTVLIEQGHKAYKATVEAEIKRKEIAAKEKAEKEAAEAKCKAEEAEKLRKQLGSFGGQSPFFPYVTFDIYSSSTTTFK